MNKLSADDINKLKNSFQNNNNLDRMKDEIGGESDEFYDGYLTGILHCYDIFSMMNDKENSIYLTTLALLSVAITRNFSEEFLEKIKDRNILKTTSNSLEFCEICLLFKSEVDYEVHNKKLKLCKKCAINAKIVFGV